MAEPIQGHLDPTVSMRAMADNYSRCPEDSTPAETIACAMPPIQGFQAPSVLNGDYALICEIARGGMGVVYKARQISLNRIVAVKFVLSGTLASEKDVDRFFLEARAAARLNHPNIVPIYDTGSMDGKSFYVMGFVDGKKLAGPVPDKVAAANVRDIAKTVGFAHQSGVIHRDLKPANILIDQEGNIRITDFGLAKIVEEDGLTSEGQILGTPSYMAPEQAAGQISEVGAPADIYGMGAILYELLTGRPPFHFNNVVDTLLHVRDSNPVPPRLLVPTVHRDLEAICLKCLQKNPAHRYPSAMELQKDLDRFLNGEAVQAEKGLFAGIMRGLVNESRHSDVMHLQSQMWLKQGVGMLAIGWLVNLLVLLSHTHFWPYTLMLGLGSALYAVTWTERLLQPSPMLLHEKQIAKIWGTFVGATLIIHIIGWFRELPLPDLMPFVILQSGIVFGCMATLMGGSFYTIAIFHGLAAILVEFFPIVGPGVFGSVFAYGLISPALRHRH